MCARRLSIWVHRAGMGLVLFAATLLLSELALRGFVASKVGPSAMFYGTPWHGGEMREAEANEDYMAGLERWERTNDELADVSEHDAEFGGFFKFHPGETKYIKDIDTGEIFPATINRHGFRGPDFSETKPDGVVRVLTLGASSTFGFYSRDDETYPALLEQRLNAACAGPERYEVINFAIPHATAENIKWMLIYEGLALEPDVLTFYEGRNDSARLHPMDFREPEQPERRALLSNHLLLLRLARELAEGGGEVDLAGDFDLLKSHQERASADFLSDLDHIRKLANEREIHLLIANQQANSKSWFGLKSEERASQEGITYQNEVDGILRLVEQGIPISGYEFNFLVHARLMEDLESWAKRNSLTFVDVIEALDQDRHHLVSWVHLDAYGNGIIAEAFAKAILPKTCSDISGS